MFGGEEQANAFGNSFIANEPLAAQRLQAINNPLASFLAAALNAMVNWEAPQPAGPNRVGPIARPGPVPGAPGGPGLGQGAANAWQQWGPLAMSILALLGAVYFADGGDMPGDPTGGGMPDNPNDILGSDPGGLEWQPPDGWHGQPAGVERPPGWNDSWQFEPPSGETCGSWRWWDTDGGEWRFHEPDQWHLEPHWDYNPWDAWNSPWQNVPVSPPVTPP